MKLTRVQISKINKELCIFNTYWCAIPLINIMDVLKKHNLILLQEDNTEFSGFLCGDSSQESFIVGNYDETVTDFFEPIENTSLQLSWYKMPSGNYEINCYLS